MTSKFKKEAQQLVQICRESIDYFVRFGTPFEKAIAQVFLEAAEVK